MRLIINLIVTWFLLQNFTIKAGTIPAVGDAAPDFHLYIENEIPVTLSAFKGKNVVIFFYPKDDTPSCRLEAQDFSRLQAEFALAGAIVIGISKDTIASHQSFRDKYNLKLRLIADIDGSIANKYGIIRQESMFSKILPLKRTTFLIDRHGKINRVWRNVTVLGHAHEVLQAVKSIS